MGCPLMLGDVRCGVGGDMLRRITAAMVAVTLLEVGAAGMANAHERPASEILNAVRSCFGKAGI